MIVQTVENGEWAFLVAMGTVIKKTLKDRETILVDGNSILCFESSVTVDVRPVGGIAAICCGGEGIFNTELTGEYNIVLCCCILCLYIYIYIYINIYILIYLFVLIHIGVSAIHSFVRSFIYLFVLKIKIFIPIIGPGTIHLQSMSIDKMRLLFPPDVVDLSAALSAAM